MKDLVEFIARSLVAHPDKVEVTEGDRDGTRVIELRVDPEDLGMVIGRRGRTATAIRTLVSAAAEPEGAAVQVEIRD